LRVLIRLTDTQVSVDGSISGSSSQVLILTVWDVEVSLGVTVFLCKTEINDINLIATLANAHEEVVRLDITVNEGLGMNILNPGDELVGKKKNGLQRELAVAEIEKILQAGSEEIKNHSIVVTLGSKPTDERDSDTTSKRFVDTCLIFKLRVFGLYALKLDGNLFTGDDIGTKVDISEAAAADLPANAVLVTHAKILSKQC
jgi:hypothetical protein